MNSLAHSPSPSHANRAKSKAASIAKALRGELPGGHEINSSSMQSALDSSVTSQPLGNIAQSSSRSAFEGKNHYKSVAKRRFDLHHRQVDLLPDEKHLAACSLHAAPFTNWIDCNVNVTKRTAFFGGLKHCDSPNCTLCAPGRAEDDRREIMIALAECKRQGYKVFHIVPTLSHYWNQTLDSQREALTETLADVFSGRWFKNFEALTGYVGRIRVLEPPFGENGWHLHGHLILIFDPASAVEHTLLDSEVLKAWLWPRYLEKLEKHGFTANAERGLQIEEGYSPLAAYVAKYGRDPVLHESGLETELTGFFLKRGKHDSLSPFELLAASAGDATLLDRLDRICHGRYSEAQLIQLASELFIEYFKTFKGKPRLVWSKGLKQKLNLSEAMDWYKLGDVAMQIQTVAQLDPKDAWRLVRGADGGDDLRADLLAELATGDAAQVRAWFEKHGIEAVYPEGMFITEFEAPTPEMLAAWEMPP